MNKALDKNWKPFGYWLLTLVAVVLLIVGIWLARKLASEYASSRQALSQQPEHSLIVKDHFSGTVYFNTDFGTEVFSHRLVNAIDAAQKRIDIAVYSFDHPAIREALYRAAQRGVMVNLLLSDAHGQDQTAVFKDSPSNFRRRELKGGHGTAHGSMHHKFMIIDQGSRQARLFFGSYNYTLLQEKYDPSFVLETDRPEIIEIFAAEFKRLEKIAEAEGSTAQVQKNQNPFAALIRYPEGYLEIWFGSPQAAGIMRQRLSGLIANAHTDLRVMIWNLTDEGIARDLMAAARRGVSVRIMTDDDTISNSASAFNWFRSEQKIAQIGNLEIRTDQNRNAEISQKYGEQNLNSFLHHHLLLIDGQTALFGTNNWSRNGFYDNYESLMVSDLPLLYNSFDTAFNDNYSRAQ